MRILQDLSKDYTQLESAKAINLNTPLRLQEAQIKAWVNEPWDGSIPIPGWKFDLGNFFKSDEGVENFLIFNSCGHSYYYPLLKLGCAVPIGLLVPKVGVRAANTNAPIIRAALLNSIKLYFWSNDFESHGLHITWSAFLEATGSKIVEEVTRTMHRLMDNNVINRVEQLENDVIASEPDAMQFPSSRTGFMAQSEMNRNERPSNRGYYNSATTYHSIKPETKQWVQQFIAFCQAKLSDIRGLTQDRGGSSTMCAKLLPYSKDNMRSSMIRVAQQLSKYLVQNPDVLADAMLDLGVSTSESSRFTFPLHLADYLSSIPPVSFVHASDLKLNALNNYVNNFGSHLEHIVALVLRSTINITELKDTKREINAEFFLKDYNSDYVFGGTTHVPNELTTREVLLKLNPSLSLSFKATGRSPYEMGIPDTDEARAALKSVGIEPLDKFFWPSELLNRGKSYLQLARDFKLWEKQNPT